MNINGQVSLGANVKINVLNARTGAILRTVERRNLVVASGRNLVRNLLNEATDAGLNYIAIGTGTNAVLSTDTALQAQVYIGAITKRTPGAQSLLLTLYVPANAANGNTLTEAGIFDDVSSSTMFARATHDAIAKTSSIAVQYGWTINIGAL